MLLDVLIIDNMFLFISFSLFHYYISFTSTYCEHTRITHSIIGTSKTFNLISSFFISHFHETVIVAFWAYIL